MALITSLLVIGLYLLPSIIAVSSKKRNGTAIFVMNILLGWSIIGWIVALIWAVTKDRP